MSTDRPTGHSLKVMRVDARVKAKDVAARMGVSSSRLSAIEREHFPSMEMTSRYLAALDACRHVSHVPSTGAPS